MLLNSHFFVIQDLVEVWDIKKTSEISLTDQINVTNATECTVVGCYELNMENNFELLHLFSPSCVLGTFVHTIITYH